jgi:hypothetical protein
MKLQPVRLTVLSICLVHCVWGVQGGIPEGYTSLFNGKDLRGWILVGTAQAFTVKDRAIYTTGARPYPSWLRSEKQYENFVLRFEYKTDGWYEGGVLIHAPVEGPASKLGLKLHLRHDQKKYGGRSPGAIYDAAPPSKIANLPSGQWNHCEITCNWPLLRVTLNNQRIHEIDMDSDDTFKYRLRRGYIGIQNIGCRASFRNIHIQVLPDEVQWTHLFASGMDQMGEQEHPIWTIMDKLLTGQGKDSNLFTKESFASPYELQVWVKTMVNGNGGVLFNKGSAGHIEVQCFNAPDSTNPTGSLYGIAPAQRVLSRDQEWFLMQVFNRGPHVTVRVNGETVAETTDLKPPHSGRIGFQQHTPGGIIHYREAKIRSLN